LLGRSRGFLPDLVVTAKGFSIFRVFCLALTEMRVKGGNGLAHRT
jgi:hypothetical protein